MPAAHLHDPALLKPFARHALRLGNLIRGHLGSQFVAGIDSFLMRRHWTGVNCKTRGRQIEPHVGKHIVLRHAPTIFIHYAEALLRAHLSLVSSFAVPSSGRRIVQPHSVAVLVQVAQIKLRAGIPMFGQRLQEPRRGRIIVASKRSPAVLKWSSESSAKQRKPQQAASKDCLEPLFCVPPTYAASDEISRAFGKRFMKLSGGRELTKAKYVMHHFVTRSAPNAPESLGENCAGSSPAHTAPSTSWKHELPKYRACQWSSIAGGGARNARH